KKWLDLQFHDTDRQLIKKPDELEIQLENPSKKIDDQLLNRVQGSFFGMTLGDALGAHVEFRPRDYLIANPVIDLESGGTWGLSKGQVRGI
ncbi:unnamed protein product, partial [Rotaria sp. Silwood2]